MDNGSNELKINPKVLIIILNFFQNYNLFCIPKSNIYLNVKLKTVEMNDSLELWNFKDNCNNDLVCSMCKFFIYHIVSLHIWLSFGNTIKLNAYGKIDTTLKVETKTAVNQIQIVYFFANVRKNVLTFIHSRVSKETIYAKRNIFIDLYILLPCENYG